MKTSNIKQLNDDDEIRYITIIRGHRPVIYADCVEYAEDNEEDVIKDEEEQ